MRLAPLGKPLPESLGQTIEVQFCLTSKPTDICPVYTPTKRGIPLHEQFAPVIFGSSRNAVISARVSGHNVDEELGRKMHAHLGSRRHQDLPFSNQPRSELKAQFGLFYVFEVRWLCFIRKQKGGQNYSGIIIVWNQDDMILRGDNNRGTRKTLALL